MVEQNKAGMIEAYDYHADHSTNWVQVLLPYVLGVLAFILLIFLANAIFSTTGGALGTTDVTAKAVGIALFGPYVIAVELASILLLAGLVTAYHLGREDKQGEVLSHRDEGGKR